MTGMMLGGGPGNKQDRARFGQLTGAQQGRAAELAQALYDGTRTVARCWAEALDTTLAEPEPVAPSPAPSLLGDEFALEGGGIAWPVRGPRGRLWQVRWEPGTPGQNIRAYRLADGHTGFYGSASTEAGARIEAVRIAGLIASGKTRDEA